MEASSSNGLRLVSESRAGVGSGRVNQVSGRSTRIITTGNASKNDPCWFLEDVSLKTGTQIVALFGIFTHPALMLTSLHYWLFGNTVPDPMTDGALALFCANAVLIPVNYILLVGAKRDNPWLCLIWITIAVVFALVDFGIVIGFYNSIYFVIFQIIIFCITVYKLWVVVSFYLSLKAKDSQKGEEGTILAKGIVTFAPSEVSMDSSRVVVIESEMVQ